MNMNRILNNRKAIKLTMLISGVFYCISQGIIINILHPLGISSVRDLQLSFDQHGIAAILDRWGGRGIEIFRTSFYLDFIHPVFYSVFLFSTLVYIRKRGRIDDEGKNVPRLFYIPFIAAIADIIENFIELSILNDYTNRGESIFFFNGLVSTIKWSLAAISLAMIFVSGVRALVATRKEKGG